MLRHPKVYAGYFALCFYTYFFALSVCECCSDGGWISFIAKATLALVGAALCVVVVIIWVKNKWRLYRWEPEHVVLNDFGALHDRFPAHKFVSLGVCTDMTGETDFVRIARQRDAHYVAEMRRGSVYGFFFYNKL